jgi:cell division protein FtsB
MLGLFFQVIFQRGARRIGFAVVIALAGAYGWIALRGPQGIQALLDKHKEIRQLEEQNAEAARENERRREHIRRLKESQSEQEMEIRKQLKLQKQGETTFILPDAGKTDAPKPAENDRE